ncbi:MAG TPA: hypothetical protein VFS77_05775, partial [Pyrinomonadaceae bacterium]|nr:hypothetical protein [Pyrinomonadaceae bacterium]
MLSATLDESEIRRAIGLPEGGTRVVDGLATLGEMQDRCLYFINKTMTDDVRESLATLRDCIVIVPTGADVDLKDCLVLETSNPRVAIAKVLKFIADEQRCPPWVSERDVSPTAVISPFAVVSERVVIGADVVIEPFCVIDDDVSIARGSIIRSGARIHSRVSIGEASSVGSNTVVGHQGFGFVRDESGGKTRIQHLGGVVIGSHVAVGVLTTVPSGTIAPTIIEDGAKVDDHVHVGHNVRIAKGASVTAGTII